MTAIIAVSVYFLGFFITSKIWYYMEQKTNESRHDDQVFFSLLAGFLWPVALFCFVLFGLFHYVIIPVITGHKPGYDPKKAEQRKKNAANEAETKYREAERIVREYEARFSRSVDVPGSPGA